MIRGFFRLLRDIGAEIKEIFSSTNTYIILPVVLLLLAAQGVVLWFGLKTDFVVNFTHGRGCYMPVGNTKIIITMFAGMFFIIATLYGLGETINLLDKRSRAKPIPPGQVAMAIGSLVVATLIALGSALFVASWC